MRRAARSARTHREVFHAPRRAGGGVTEPEFLSIVRALAALRQGIDLAARPSRI